MMLGSATSGHEMILEEEENKEGEAVVDAASLPSSDKAGAKLKSSCKCSKENCNHCSSLPRQPDDLEDSVSCSEDDK